ncbi:antibiotic resistance protein VanZ [bacterium]|nr:antibiotic resistance protein VanZ [bacterium]
MRRPWLLYLVLIFGLSSIPADPRPKHAPMFLDKVAHFVLFSGLGFVFAGSEDGRRWSGLRLVLATALLAGGVGLADEFYQGFVPNRSRELADWLADLGGGICGGLLALGPRPEAAGEGEGERTP